MEDENGNDDYQDADAYYDDEVEAALTEEAE